MNNLHRNMNFAEYSNLIHTPLVHIDEAGLCVCMNHAWKQAMSQAGNALWYEIIPEDFRSDFLATLQENLSKKQTFSLYFQSTSEKGHQLARKIIFAPIESQIDKGYVGTLISSAEFGNLKAMLDNMEDAIWAIDKEFKLIAFNSTFQKSFSAYFGQKMTLGFNIASLVSDSYDFWKSQYTRGFLGEQFSFDFEIMLEKSPLVSNISVSPIYNHLNEVSGVTVASRDISHRINSEKKLISTQKELSKAQVFAKMGWWTLNLATLELTLSKEKQMVLKIKPENDEPKIMNLYEYAQKYVLEEDVPIIQAGVGKLAENIYTVGYELELDYRSITPDNSPLYIHLHCSVEEGGIITGFSQDITLRKQAELDLEMQKQFIEKVLHTIPNMVFVKDILGRFVLVNHAVAKMYGTTPEELIGKSDVDFNPNEAEVNYFLQIDRQVIISKEVLVIPEEPVTNPHTNETRYFQTVKVPLEIDEKTTQILGVSTDITDRKLAEGEKAQLMEDLVRNVQDLEQFAYIVSHNLRSPVARILGLTKLIENKDQESKMNKIILNGLEEEAKQLDNIIFDLNTIVGIRNNQGEKRVPIVLDELVDLILFSLKADIETAEVNIHVDTESCNTVYAIRTYVHSIILNMLTNAIKYRSPKRKPEISIGSTYTSDKKYIVMRISDNGLGIDLVKNKNKVFGLYNRFHNHVEGKGLGLHISKTQIERMGGKIELESEPDKGTTFYLYFLNINYTTDKS